jgi:hypothetical protein
MRWYQGPSGDQRVWFDPEEIETMLEDELRRGGLMPTSSNPVTDIERFIEDHFGALLDQYAELDPTVLGVTHFHRGQPPTVSINRDLTGALDEDYTQPGLQGRWRATLAHEATHVCLHRMLFELNADQGALFADEGELAGQPLMRCLKRDVGHRIQTSDWREVQANRGMAAVLMPRKLFTRITRTEMAELGATRAKLRDDPVLLSQLTRRLADRLMVSRQAATIRLKVLGFLPTSGSLDLPL